MRKTIVLAAGVAGASVLFAIFRDPALDASGERIGTADTRVQIIDAVAGDDLSFILDCTIALDGGRLVFTGAPATVSGQQTSHLTFELSRK